MQRSRGDAIKRCTENMQKIYRDTHMPKCDFKKLLLTHRINLEVPKEYDHM